MFSHLPKSTLTGSLPYSLLCRTAGIRTALVPPLNMTMQVKDRITFCHEGSHEMHISRAVSMHRFTVTAFMEDGVPVSRDGSTTVGHAAAATSPLPFQMLVNDVRAGWLQRAWNRLVAGYSFTVKMSPYGTACVSIVRPPGRPGTLMVSVTMGSEGWCAYTTGI